MFGSPTSFCPICNDWIALDQSFEECAQNHRCRGSGCPLRELFAEERAQVARDPGEAPLGRRGVAVPPA